MTVERTDRREAGRENHVEEAGEEEEVRVNLLEAVMINLFEDQDVNQEVEEGGEDHKQDQIVRRRKVVRNRLVDHRLISQYLLLHNTYTFRYLFV